MQDICFAWSSGKNSPRVNSQICLGDSSTVQGHPKAEQTEAKSTWLPQLLKRCTLNKTALYRSTLTPTLSRALKYLRKTQARTITPSLKTRRPSQGGSMCLQSHSQSVMVSWLQAATSFPYRAPGDAGTVMTEALALLLPGTKAGQWAPSQTGPTGSSQSGGVPAAGQGALSGQ